MKKEYLTLIVPDVHVSFHELPILKSIECSTLYAGDSAMLSLLALLPVVARALPTPNDPCAAIAGKPFVVPAAALACQKSFPFNETLRQNVLSNIARVLDFYTFEDFYFQSPPPFQESTVDIRAQLARINSSHYEVCILELSRSGI